MGGPSAVHSTCLCPFGAAGVLGACSIGKLHVFFTSPTYTLNAFFTLVVAAPPGRASWHVPNGTATFDGPGHPRYVQSGGLFFCWLERKIADVPWKGGGGARQRAACGKRGTETFAERVWGANRPVGWCGGLLGSRKKCLTSDFFVVTFPAHFASPSPGPLPFVQTKVGFTSGRLG